MLAAVESTPSTATATRDLVRARTFWSRMLSDLTLKCLSSEVTAAVLFVPRHLQLLTLWRQKCWLWKKTARSVWRYFIQTVA